ncbi:mycothione reductase [Corynebacterium glucuronolyticum]|uniref:Mycothione reductase n=2 Tax=Corynebacterium glucuronolyticum TaxID=39791 RepID=A0A7T4JU54_9CORY|nr:mycothione reductase [Corynebacterium glucuronolyticum]EEI62020.1 mycothione reductase [Corynebacterium glucuronolyticum ATCC 51866]QQB45509.1 mycothione reductase [Corynebacterium glucuronolyticum]QRP69740.1 mycothione reductase [Corynebacterium glucuronolyticum]WKD63850.1 Mycothione reductase [Corynebacterium glucuronolyticum DSM 44120]SMB86148.1 dihydrolipoamide dehydrogenase [Corynebacterium glucuronolyticum]
MAHSAHFDLIIVGTGSGNMIPDERFDDMSIAIVEEDRFGGTCLNVGCIPTKMFVYAADRAFEAADSSSLSLRTSYEGIDWNELQNRIFGKRIDPIAEGGEKYRRGDETPNITVFDKHARFIGPKTLSTGQGDTKWEISGDTIILATGARTNVLDVVKDSGVRYYTNKDIMRLEELPSSMIIQGGGVIAAEFAHVFSALGTKVSIINRSGELLKTLDADIRQRFNEIAVTRWDLHLGHEIDSLTTEENGQVTAVLDDSSRVTADIFLAATGRIPNGDLLNLEASGIAHDRGLITVDEFGRTSCEGVWALGDACNTFQLKHVANAEARAVANNVLNPDNLITLPHDYVPAGIFTHPQIATVGLTEEEAREKSGSVTVKIQNYGDVAFGWAMEDSTGIVKLIGDSATGKLLGAHIIGPQATTLIQQLITAMVWGIGYRDLATKQYWIHPALPEVIENALLGLD